MKIYTAGPLFTPYHRAFIARFAQRLREAGFICYVPHERGVTREIEWASGQPRTAKGIFEMDYEMVAGVNAVVALLDDPDVSSGTACEIGIFYGLMQHDPTKKGIVGLLTDAQAWKRAQVGAPPVNAFTLGCVEDVGKTCRTIEEVIDQLNTWQHELREAGLLDGKSEGARP